MQTLEGDVWKYPDYYDFYYYDYYDYGFIAELIVQYLNNSNDGDICSNGRDYKWPIAINLMVPYCHQLNKWDSRKLSDKVADLISSN